MLLWIICIELVGISFALHFKSITEPIALNPVLFPKIDSSSVNIDIDERGLMTNYIDPTTNVSYLWVNVDAYYENTSYIRSDIFNYNFTQYSNNNNDISNLLPLPTEQIDMQYNQYQLFDGISCTSPITNDIITCWIKTNSTAVEWIDTAYNIECKIFFTKTNKFSNTINITNDSCNVIENVNIVNKFSGLICFDDSYFIPYWYDNTDSKKPMSVYGTFIDLNGNIIYNSIPLPITLNQTLNNNDVFPFNEFPLAVITASNKFNVKNINKNASQLLLFETLVDTKDDYTQHVNASFAYYTNINDTQFPLHFYILNKKYTANEKGEMSLPIVIDVNEECCYLITYSFPYDYAYLKNIYGIFIDIYGNVINIDNYNNTVDILLIEDVNDDIDAKPYKLPMISNVNSTYFMITFAKESVALLLTARVYSLSYDNNKMTYSLDSI